MARRSGRLGRPVLPIATGLVVAAVTVGTVSWTLTGHESGPPQSSTSASGPQTDRQSLQRASRDNDRTEVRDSTETKDAHASGSGASDNKDADESHGDQSSAAGQNGSCAAGYVATGTTTAKGDKFNADALTGANLTLPFGSQVRITNPDTGKSVVITINDRGPYSGDRCFDLTSGAYSKIASLSDTSVQINYVVLS
ncbi:MAG: septal ring lytic transglycosylase RlpA family protein [Actinocatenispora sp.]